MEKVHFMNNKTSMDHLKCLICDLLSDTFRTCFPSTERTGYPICLVHVLITVATGFLLASSRCAQRSSVGVEGGREEGEWEGGSGREGGREGREGRGKEESNLQQQQLGIRVVLSHQLKHSGRQTWSGSCSCLCGNPEMRNGQLLNLACYSLLSVVY